MQQRETTRARRTLQILAWGFPVIAVLGVWRWLQIGAYPSGGDPGNWFAIGKALFGEHGKNTPTIFPPLVPFVMHLGSLIADEMIVAKVMAIASIVAIVIAVYVVALSAMRSAFAATAATIVGLSSYVNEVAAFGGYPQNIATAVLVLVAMTVAQFLNNGGRKNLVLSAGLLVLAALSHHATFAITCLVVALVWALWISELPERRTAILRTVGLVGAGLAGVLAFLPVLLMLVQAGYQPPVNLTQLGFSDRFQYSSAEAPLLWVWAIVSGVTFLAFSVRRRHEAIWKVATALTVAGALLYVIAGEVRAYPPVVIGAALGLGLAFQGLFDRVAQTRWRVTAVATLAVFLVALGVRSEQRLQIVFPYYTIADAGLLDATKWVEAHRGDGTFAVRQFRNRWPVVWWFEGLTDASLIGGADERLLAFPTERANAQLVAALFDVRDDPREIVSIARDNGIRYLVFRPEDWQNWRVWWDQGMPFMHLAYDNGEYMIVDVGEQ